MTRQSSYQLARLRRSIHPLRLHFFPRLGSTNDHALEMRRRRVLFAPALVLTAVQTRGRGRGRGRGRNAWWSGPASITASLVLPVHEQLAPHQLPLIAGVALRSALAELAGDANVQLKWPNDVLHRGRKLAGLLCERAGGLDIIGIGLNINVAPDGFPPHLRPTCTSLAQIASRPFDKTDVLIAVARRVHTMIALRGNLSFNSVLREYDRHDYLRGRRISVQLGVEPRPVRGTADGLDSMGRLLLRQRERGDRLRIVAGHVQVQ
jgi:BirA family biotin operon repressor/biotin-[acetyl-CoA-carboxylase] ligase